MSHRPWAGVLIAILAIGCGASPTNPVTPASSLGNPMTPLTPIQPQASVGADPGTDETDPETASDVEASPEPTPSPSETPPAVVPDLPEIGGNGATDQVFPLKNGWFKDWQATGIAVSSGSVYITASDRQGIRKRGTVLKLDAKGKWKDLGDSLLGLRHRLNNTVRGLAIDASGNLTAVEASGHLGFLLPPKYTLKLITGGPTGLLDVVASNNSFYISLNNQIRKYSPDMGSSEAVASNLQLTGGMGVDKDGSFYAVSMDTIIKVTKTGESRVIIGNVINPVDVAIDGQGRIVVLGNTGLTVYDAAGQKVKSVGDGVIINGAALAIDGNAAYVADTGKSRKDSQVLSFGI